MVTETIARQSIGDAMVYIADKIGLTLEQVYQIYVGSQMALALIQIALILVFVIGSVTICFLCFRTYKNETKDSKDYDHSDAQLKYGMFAIFGCAMLGLAVALLYSPITAVVCPEYSAIQAMIGDFASLVS
jgi:hypothetical protein